MNNSWPSGKARLLHAELVRRGFPVNRWGSLINSPMSEPVGLAIWFMSDGWMRADAGLRDPFRAGWNRPAGMHLLHVEAKRMRAAAIADQIVDWLSRGGIA